LFWESALISPIVNAEGDIINIVSVKEDITKFRSVKAQLEKNEERYRITTEATGDVFYRLNYENMTYEYIHPNIKKLTGYSANEINLRKIIIEIKKSSEIVDINEMEKERKNSKISILLADYLIKTKDGEEKWISDRSYPWFSNNGVLKGTQGVLSNITKRKELEKELLNAKKIADNANKMKSIFLANMSHEIRTPINGITSMASMLKDDFRDQSSEDQLTSFDIIEIEGKRIIKTIELLLNLSEIDAGIYEKNITKFNLYSNVLSVLIAENKKKALDKNIILSLMCNTRETDLHADLFSVNQIFIQLLDNAIKFTKDGEIIVRLFRNEIEELIVEIEDTGIGIEVLYLKNIFEPFTQEEIGYSRKFDGNGIGLALVKKYCELNNAKIEVESKRNVGSTFRVIFCI